MKKNLRYLVYFIFLMFSNTVAAVTALYLEGNHENGYEDIFWVHDVHKHFKIEKYDDISSTPEPIGVKVTIGDGSDAFIFTPAGFLGSGVWETEPLSVGTYLHAVQGHETQYPRLALHTAARYGCRLTATSFTVLEVVYSPNGDVTSFAVDFERVCDNANAPITGQLRYNSDIPFANISQIPTPVYQPSPLNEPEPSHYANPITALHIVMKTPDFHTRELKDETWVHEVDGLFTLSESSDHTKLTFNYHGSSGNSNERLVFEAPNYYNPASLKEGLYTYQTDSVTGAKSQELIQPFMLVPSLNDGTPCAVTKGLFKILNLVRNQRGAVISFAADFEKYCLDGRPVLVGEVRFNSKIVLSETGVYKQPASYPKPFVNPVPLHTPEPVNGYSYTRGPVGGLSYAERTGDGVEILENLSATSFTTTVDSLKRLSVSFNAQGKQVSLQFNPPEFPSLNLLSPGEYSDAVGGLLRPSFSFLEGGIRLGGSCIFATTSKFTILDIVYSRDKQSLTSLAVNFEKTCNNLNHISGEIRYNSHIPFTERQKFSVQDLFPMRPGTIWNYTTSEGFFSTTVLAQKHIVNGVETIVLQDSDGYREYFTNDERGLRLHKIEEPVETGTGIFVFEPPIKLSDQDITIGTELSSQGTATMTYPGLGVFILNYSIYSRIVGREDISISSGNYDGAHHLNYSMTIDGNVGGNSFFSVDVTNLLLVSGIGPVRFDSFDFLTAELVNVNIPQSIPPMILWRHAGTGYSEFYLMNGTDLTSFGVVNTLTDLNWIIVGNGDFDADGENDLLWRNSQTGENRIDFMIGTQVSRTATVSTVADRRWKVTGVADFDGNGKDDILWRHDENGRVWMSLMDGATIIGSHHIAYTGLDWVIKGVGDFDGDGRGDILWQNVLYGRVWLYLMDGETIHTNQHVAFSGSDWDIKGIGDFNGDNKQDIFWRNELSGVNWMYIMNGTQIINNTYVDTLADQGWKLGLTQDFNGDGRTDVLWRHAITGENLLYQMNGNSIMDSRQIHQVSDLNWKIAN